MSVRLRFKRIGRTHKPVFRLSAIDSRRRRDGRLLEELGQYDPANKDAALQVKLNVERIQHWLSVGARPTETVRHLLNKNGIVVK